MKILAISDWHQAEEVLNPFRKLARSADADFIVFTGDILKWRGKATEWAQARSEGRAPDTDKFGIKEEIQGNQEVYRKFLEVLKESSKTSFVIPGNVDAPIRQYLQQHQRPNFPKEEICFLHHASCSLARDFVVSGFGGEITDDDEEEEFFVLSYPRGRLEYSLNPLAKMPGEKMVLFHTPPVGELDLEEDKHKGHRVINDLIQKIKPKWTFCGHAHTARGQEEIGDCVVVNPGALKNGFYATVDTDTRKVGLQSL